ncbi:carboxylate--amine ligase [Pseudothermotoga lettingae]|uniref:ATP-grasp domain-containing protein n=1 Tax=Pseudothermotoga lettingae (strain ATCC BAA-301 / DSM 14385 / NBRC 107922 / TMO) TaxID=416591 RepID=A8F6F3_PSELT|nr:ATP-grasp domain-containing protein [Pseudothermotoga lettingae]ABV33737.1 protein of unknown function DUF201 [Pseudothermotoga lettingae TMO]GLI49345.1 ATP-grasp protein [Pseudothermotoga lettingae TMO]
MYNFLLIEAEYRKVLPVIRHIGKSGYGVYAISLNRFSIGGSSKYVKKNYFMRDLELQTVLNIIDKNKIDIVIPCNEKSVRFLSKHIDKFETTIVTPNIDSFELCEDKLRTLQLAESLNIRIPKTHYFHNLAELNENLDKIDFSPAVLKPRKSSGSRGIIYVKSKDEILGVLNNDYIEKFGMPLVQEYIPQDGESIGVSFLYYKSNKIMEFCHKRIRQYPPTGGPSTLAVSIYDEEAIKIGEKLLNALKWNGLAMVEFKRDPTTKELVLMEVNPRMWGTIGLALFSGADFIRAIVEVFLKNNLNLNYPKYNEGYYFRWFFPGDILSIIKSQDLSFLKKLKSLLFDKHKPVSYQILDGSDLLPVLNTILFSIFRKS